MTPGILNWNTVSVMGSFDSTIPETELRFEDGRTLRVSTAMLQQGQPLVSPAGLPSDDAVLIPLVEEQLTVGKRTVETGKVHLHKSSEVYDVSLNEPLAVKTWSVRRVPRNEVVPQAPALRQEGSTTIYPLVEERLILTKELVLIEEIHITQDLSERRDTQTVTLRRETLSVERETVQPA